MFSLKLQMERSRKRQLKKQQRQKRKSARGPKKPETFVYLVKAVHDYGKSGIDVKISTIGIYSTKEIALESATDAFEDEFSSGNFEDGKFKDPSIFEEVQNNVKTIGEEGTIFYQLDQEGDKVEILLEKVQLDKPFWEPDE
jgi:hypothetical protein